MFGIDDAILGGALSFGGKLLSGLGAQQSAKKQNKVMQAVAGSMQRTADDFLTAENLQISHWNPVKDAERFGFNPVTWLSSGVATSQLNASLAALEAKHQSYDSSFSTVAQGNVQVPSTLSAIGGAVSAGVDSWSTMRQAQMRSDSDAAKTAAYLQSVQSARAKGNKLAGAGTPALSMAGAAPTGGGAAAALSIPTKLNLFGQKDTPGEVTDLAGAGVYTDKSMPNTDNFTQRWGFLPGQVAGAGVFAWDVYRTVTGRQLSGDLAYGVASAPKSSAGVDEWARRSAAGEAGPMQMDWLSGFPSAASPRTYQPEIRVPSGSLSPFRYDPSVNPDMGYRYGD